jgi:broad specificity phosphatase PhoE
MHALKHYLVGWLALLLLLPAASALAQMADVKMVAELLQGGGYVIVFRHGATNRDQADTDPLNPDDVSKQRLLSNAGREAAGQIGMVFRTMQIPIDKVYTSRFNRAVETGKLIGTGAVTTTSDLTEGGLVVTPIENDRRAQALRMLAATPPAKGKNNLLITHKPNILDAFGKDWFDVKEGEASVFLATADGKALLIARIQAADWAKALR